MQNSKKQIKSYLYIVFSQGICLSGSHHHTEAQKQTKGRRERKLKLNVLKEKANYTALGF